MIIAICGDCGWLGGPPDLNMVKGVSEELLKDLNPLMLGNKDASHLCCPNCNKSQIFYKNLGGGDVPSPSFLGGATVLSAQPIYREAVSLPREVRESVVESQAVPQPTPQPEPVQEKKELDTSIPPMPDELIPPPAVDSRGRALQPGSQPVTEKGHTLPLYTCFCDECGDDFKSKVERQTRCDRCVRKITGSRAVRGN